MLLVRRLPDSLLSYFFKWREIKGLGIDGAMSIELEYSPEPDKIADWVREAYTATDRLMQDAGLRG